MWFYYRWHFCSLLLHMVSLCFFPTVCFLVFMSYMFLSWAVLCKCLVFFPPVDCIALYCVAIAGKNISTFTVHANHHCSFALQIWMWNLSALKCIHFAHKSSQFASGKKKTAIEKNCNPASKLPHMVRQQANTQTTRSRSVAVLK